MSANKMHTLRHDYINVLKRELLNVSDFTDPSSGTRHPEGLIINSNVRNCPHKKNVKIVKL